MTPIKPYSIKLTALKYGASEKTYGVEGLSFPLRVYYNVEKDCMELLTYNTGKCDVAMWDSKTGYLTSAAGVGMIAQLKEGTDNVYKFVDNGVWGTYIARAIILWGSSSDYFGYGGDTRYPNIVFTKK